MEDYSDGILDTSLDYEARKTPPVEKKKKPKFNLQVLVCLFAPFNI